MPRRSRFEQMDVEIRAAVDRLIREGRTIQEIRDHLAELGEAVSNGSAGRYVRNARANMKRFREAQEVAGMWVHELHEQPRGDVSVLLADLLKSVAFNTLDTMTGGEDGTPAKPVKPMEIMLLAKAIKDLEATQKQSMDRRERIEKAVLERQVKVAENTARAEGVSEAGWERIRAKFLGIDQQAAQ